MVADHLDVYIEQTRILTWFWNQKLYPDFSKKGPDCIHLRVKLVLRVSRRKNFKVFSLRDLFFLCFWRNFYLSALVLQPLLPFFFAKRSILNIWQCSEYVCLDNCPVIFRVTLCYVLHQTHSEFGHIYYSVLFQVCAVIFNHIQCYYGIFTHTELFLRHIQAYSASCVILPYLQPGHTKPWNI